MQKEQILISVVLTCYNLGKYIESTITSVEEQSFRDWELIIVDDGSDDPTTQGVIRKIIKERPNYVVLIQNNQGVSIARNNGIERARGKYIVCLDADDELDPLYLERCYEALSEAGKNVGIATTWVQEFDGRNNLWKPAQYDPTAILVNNQICGSSLFFKKVWEDVGGYKPEMAKGYEDWEFWISAIELGYEWVVIEAPLFNYRIRQGSRQVNAEDQHLELYSQIYKLHQEYFTKHQDQLILGLAHESRNLHLTIKSKNQSLEEISSKLATIQDKLFDTNEELSNLKNSRLIGLAIKLRARIGSIIRFTKSISRVPWRVLRRVRVAIAPLVPVRIRKALKTLMRRLIKKDRTQDIVYLDQEPWPSKLPLVSAVVPYYNAHRTVEQTLASIYAQTLRGIEVVLIDDCSTETDSVLKLKELERLYPDLTIIRNEENRGVAQSRNIGMATCSGKYIVCIDSDDWIEPQYIEKAILKLEANPNIDLVTPYTRIFGVKKGVIKYLNYDKYELIKNNMVIHAAVTRRSMWDDGCRYKPGIGYEDWEYWITAAEKGHWGATIPEVLFNYRTAISSRYIDDRAQHRQNTDIIYSTHVGYKKSLATQINKKGNKFYRYAKENVFRNIEPYLKSTADTRPAILIVIPWMTFGGAETLIYNFTKEIKKHFDITFMTGIRSENEWEHKFAEVSAKIYHLPNLFDEQTLYLEFISLYIGLKNVKILHVIHNGFMFDMIPELKSRHPYLKIIITMFNDRVDYFEQSVQVAKFIDLYTTDNKKVQDHYTRLIGDESNILCIPNGIDTIKTFKRSLYDRSGLRKELSIKDDEIACFFVGRLSVEKNPNIFVSVASTIIKQSAYSNLRFFVIGDGPMKNHVINQIEEIGDDRIKYIGYIEKVASYLAAADIFILPSAIEGFPLSLLEAMSMGVVSVASDVGAVREVIEGAGAGFVVNPGSEEEIVEILKDLSKRPKNIQEIGKAARIGVEKKYSAKILGKNYKDLYGRLL